MNERIVSLFEGFTVGGVPVPVKLLYYHGHGEPYITFMTESEEGALYGDDGLLETVLYYDFDVYARGDYTEIVSAMKTLLEANGFVWQPSRSSGDLYEPDTGYYHKTMNFAVIRED